MHGLVVYCADVGSVARGHFAWAQASARSRKPSTSSNIRHLVEAVAADLRRGLAVALGFECPLFVPLPEDPAKLTSARPGEGSRPWSAAAGAGALAIGLPEVCWVLQELRLTIARPARAHLDWQTFTRSGRGLFLWEAFVTAKAKGQSHRRDAEIGARAFLNCLPDVPAANAVKSAGQVYSLVGAALLRTGWTRDLAVLRTPCIVVRA